MITNCVKQDIVYILIREVFDPDIDGNTTYILGTFLNAINARNVFMEVWAEDFDLNGQFHKILVALNKEEKKPIVNTSEEYCVSTSSYTYHLKIVPQVLQ